MTGDPFSLATGIHHEVNGEGRVTSRAQLGPAHKNALGAVHGALLYAMADTGMGLALATLLPEDVRCATLAAHIQYFEPPSGDVLVATSTIVHRGAKVATARCEIAHGSGSLCAVATASFYISAPRDAGTT